MKRMEAAAALALLFSFSAPLAAEVHISGAPRVERCAIYGNDDRVDYYGADEVSRRLADSTAALFNPSKLVSGDGGRTYTLVAPTLGDRLNLAEGQNFATQPAGAFCSGVLVGDDLLLTSGHCLAPHPGGGPCRDIKIAFGYVVREAGAFPETISGGDVYGCSRVISSVVDPGRGRDYALIKLDRKVTGGRVPLAINRGEPPAPGTAVFTIGSPGGLPLKIAGSARVRSVEAGSGYFVADLDTFKGNSGSPVFNASTLMIEGLLSKGGTDYVYADGDGAVLGDPQQPYAYDPGSAQVYGQDEGRGEDVSLLDGIKDSIPVSGLEHALIEAQRRGVEIRPQSGTLRTVPAIYDPSNGAPAVVPAIYVPEPRGSRAETQFI